MTDAPAPKSPHSRRWIPRLLYAAAWLLTAYTMLRFGSLQTVHAFALAQSQAGPPDPHEVSYLKYEIAVLWPLPAVALIVLSGVAFAHQHKLRWLLLATAALWLGAYYLIRPPQLYYYFLSPFPAR